ncbi:MAG: hypothetical protein HOJ93_05725 [Acidimicrobiaceae bacterium]|nr:hypothetical protein [Acidimicrobiaceae bacterium]
MAFRPLASIPRSGRQLGLLLAFTGMFIVSTDSLLIRVAERDSQIDGWTIAFMVGLFSTPVAWSMAIRALGRRVLAESILWRRQLLTTGTMSAISTTSILFSPSPVTRAATTFSSLSKRVDGNGSNTFNGSIVI